MKFTKFPNGVWPHQINLGTKEEESPWRWYSAGNLRDESTWIWPALCGISARVPLVAPNKLTHKQYLTASQENKLTHSACSLDNPLLGE